MTLSQSREMNFHFSFSSQWLKQWCVKIVTKNGNFSENCLNNLVIVDNHWVGSVLITSNIIGVTLGELQTGLKLSKLLYVALWKIWVALLDRKRGNLGGKQVGKLVAMISQQCSGEVSQGEPLVGFKVILSTPNNICGWQCWIRKRQSWGVKTVGRKTKGCEIEGNNKATVARVKKQWFGSAKGARGWD